MEDVHHKTKSTLHEFLSTGYIRYEHLPMETKDGKCVEVEFISNVYQIGSQIGMAMVYGIVKNHGGRISIESQVNQGTAVCIYLPTVGLPKKASMSSPSAM